MTRPPECRLYRDDRRRGRADPAYNAWVLLVEIVR
jgi:hypothetical protein